MSNLPEFLKQGSQARLFPILADTNREQRITSVFLSLLSQIPALAEVVLGSAGVKVGKRSRIHAYTEVVFKKSDDAKNRPDGLITHTSGRTEWTAIIEAKIKNATLDEDQVKRYLDTARANDIHAVITISNQFVARADHSPVSIPKNLLRKTALLHWSWTWITTQCEILVHQKAVEDDEQAFLLKEFLAFLSNPATGIERFTQMNAGWKELVQTISNNSTLKKTAPEVEDGVGCWFQEERDLCLQLSRHIGQEVEAVIEKKLKQDPVQRLKNGINDLVENHCLSSAFRIPDSAADIEICADVARRTISVSMKIKAPLDRRSTKARVNWLLRMLKTDDPRILIRAHWPGRIAATDCFLHELREDVSPLQPDNQDLTPHAFEIFMIERPGKRFAGRKTFIEDLERITPEFYDLIGQHLRVWQPTPPRPVKARVPAEDNQISKDAQGSEETLEP